MPQVYPNNKCALLHWTYPLPINTDTFTTLTDPVGNKCECSANLAPPTILPRCAQPFQPPTTRALN